MKKFITFLTLLMFFNCGSETIENNCFLGISVNETLDLNNALFVDLQLPTAEVTVTLPRSGRRVLIIKNNSSSYRAFDLQCPEKDCTSPMTFDGLKLNCTCGDHHYSSLNGQAVDSSGNLLGRENCGALTYFIQEVNASTLQIRN